MSSEKSKSEYPVAVEPPEVAVKRDRLLAALDKEIKTVTGTGQQVMRKMHDLVSSTKPGTQLNMNLFVDVKNAFLRFMKDPILPPPPILTECTEFIQSYLVAMGFKGYMEWPEEAGPIPAAYTNVNLAEGLPPSIKLTVTPPRIIKRPSKTQNAHKQPRDGFESGPPSRPLPRRPPTAQPVAAQPAARAAAPAAPQPAGKPEKSNLDTFKSWLRNAGADGKTKG